VRRVVLVSHTVVVFKFCFSVVEWWTSRRAQDEHRRAQDEHRTSRIQQEEDD
jgi:hypothetical protein